MVRVEVTETFACTPDEFLEFVMDIERYAEIDKKISPILWQRRDGNLLEFACRPTLAGLPQPKVVQQVRLTPGARIDISLSPPPHNRLAHATAHFEASFECTPVAGGTQVTRTLEFRFTPALRWILEPLLRRRLPGEVRAEIQRAKQHLEDAHPGYTDPLRGAAQRSACGTPMILGVAATGPSFGRRMTFGLRAPLPRCHSPP